MMSQRDFAGRLADPPTSAMSDWAWIGTARHCRAAISYSRPKRTLKLCIRMQDRRGRQNAEVELHGRSDGKHACGRFDPDLGSTIKHLVEMRCNVSP